MAGKPAKSPGTRNKRKSGNGGGRAKAAPPRRPGGVLVQIVVCVLLLVAAVVLAAFLADRWLGSPPVPHKTSRTHKPEKPYHTVQNVPPATTSFGSRGKATLSQPVYEVYTNRAVHGPSGRPPIREHVTGRKPRIAIIIDDLGYERRLGRELIALSAPLTFSVLPYSPCGRELADLAASRGREILLHLPMEPMEYPQVDSGPGTLLASMDTDALLHAFEEDLREVPRAVGVNNHMGSRLTAMSNHINPLFTRLKRENLFFVDSRTTAETQCRAAARLNQVPFTERDVFLDHKDDPAFVRRQLQQLVRLARERGFAVGIGHPHENTYQVLAEMLPRIESEVEVVPVSALVREVRY